MKGCDCNYSDRINIISPFRLEFLDNLDIVAMFSSEGEKVQMSTAISTSAARGAVEKWLLQVQDTMIVSVRDVTAKARDVSRCMHMYGHAWTCIE